MENKKLDKEFLKYMGCETENEIKEAMRDIIGRYGRPTNMGGYSLNFLTDQMYMFIYCMFHKFREEYQELIKEETKRDALVEKGEFKEKKHGN